MIIVEKAERVRNIFWKIKTIDGTILLYYKNKNQNQLTRAGRPYIGLNAVRLLRYNEHFFSVYIIVHNSISM